MVGTNTATCLLSTAALKAARIATSVLPKPTSPQTSRSIGRALSISCFSSCVAFSWSGVSSYKNEASNSCCINESGEKAKPFSRRRLAYNLIRSRARSLILFFALSFSLSHAPEPKTDSNGGSPELPLRYLLIL